VILREIRKNEGVGGRSCERERIREPMRARELEGAREPERGGGGGMGAF
jgi:hypothetical protein